MMVAFAVWCMCMCTWDLKMPRSYIHVPIYLYSLFTCCLFMFFFHYNSIVYLYNVTMKSCYLWMFFLMLNNNNNDDIKKLSFFMESFHLSFQILHCWSLIKFHGKIFSEIFPIVFHSMIIIGEKYEYIQ